MSTLLAMVGGGIGATLLPAMAADSVRRAHPEIRLIPFGSSGPGRTIGLAWRRSSGRADEFRMLASAITAR